MSTEDELRALLDETLQLRGRAQAFTAETRLLGELPELDSMAVVLIVEALEERFGLRLEEDEVTAELFATLGSLQAVVDAKRAPR